MDKSCRYVCTYYVYNINKVVPSAQKCDIEQKIDTFFVDVIYCPGTHKICCRRECISGNGQLVRV